jgi:hypothetical protein
MNISLILTLIVIGITVVLFVEARRRKARDTRSHHTVLLGGFPIVHVPMSLPRDDAEAIAGNLQTAYNAVWSEMSTIYGVKSKPAGIATIGTSLFDVDPDHPHVLWLAPGDKIYLRIQPTMYYWFMWELHNLFRYQLHGMKWIYKTKDDVDEAHRASVGSWIEKNC